MTSQTPDNQGEDEAIRLSSAIATALIVQCIWDVIRVADDLARAAKETQERGGEMDTPTVMALIDSFTKVTAATAVLNALGLVNNVEATRIVQERLLTVMPTPNTTTQKPN